VYPSPLVRYEDTAGHAPGTVHDYDSEFRGIQVLRAAGLGDVEVHGFTHMHPDSEAWASAADRFESWPDTSWFREFGRAAASTIARRPPHDHPLTLAVDALRQYFGVTPTTLICPGDQWTDETLERALDLQIQIVASYYLAIRHQHRYCWAQHVCAPYLDAPDASWFASGLPTVGYFHDREPALEGVEWLTTWLDRWQEAGARRLIDFRELASALGLRLAIMHRDGVPTLSVTQRGGPCLVRPVPVRIRMAGRLPRSITVEGIGGPASRVEILAANDGTGLVYLPVT
jgi:hypothetical protein